MCLSELRPSMMKTNHDKARDFVESPWMPWYLVAIYRCIIAAYCTSWIIYSGFYYSNGGVKWFIWLTNWGFFCVTVSFIHSTVVTLWYHCKEKNQINVTRMEMTDASSRENAGEDEAENEFPPRWYHKALWVIYTTSTNVAINITILFWGIIYRGGDASSASMGLNISTHLLNFVFLLLDLLLSSMPIRFLHVVYPMIFTVVYFLFTVIYWAAGGTNPVNDKRYIYSIVDYSNSPGVAIGLFFGVMLVVEPLIQLVLFGLYKLRGFVARKCRGDQYR